MANISTGSEGGGRKSVDSEIPLVPFIDLLLCCVMFLLVTAVWNQLAAVETSTPDATPGAPTLVDSRVDAPPVYVELTRHDAAVSFPDGTSARVARGELPSVLTHVPEAEVIEMLPDDDVPHEEVVDALSALRGAGHPRVRLLYSRPAG